MIATVLLIAFIVAVVVLIILWGKGYIEELAEKRGALAEKQQECTKIKLDVVKACWRGNNADIVIRSQANIPIHKFIFRAVGNIGEPVERFGREWRLGALETKEYSNIDFSTDVGLIKKIDIIPHLQVALGHYVPCSKQKISVKLTDNCN